MPDIPVQPEQLSSYVAIVRAYRAMRREGDPDQNWYAAMALSDAIEYAAKASTKDDKRHPHQARITLRAIGAATLRLRKISSSMRACRNFDGLHALLETTLRPIAGVGDLYIYDCAQRIGWALRHYPQKVYLHRGTRTGAKTLGIDVRGRATIEVAEVPAALRVLSAAELEDVLCMFKDELKRCAESQHHARVGR